MSATQAKKKKQLLSQPPENTGGKTASSPPSPVGADPQDHKQAAVSGVVWSAVGLVLSQALRLVGNIILSRILFPSDFGVMALVGIFIYGIEMFSDLGIWRSVAQNERGAEPTFLNTAYTIQAIRGVALWAIAAALAWPYAAYYDEPMLVPYICVSGIMSVLLGLQSPSLMVHRRQMSLAVLTKAFLGAQAVSLAVMLTWAAIHPSPWALVVGGIAEAAVIMLASHTWLSLYSPRFEWNADARRELIRFGKWIFLSSALTLVVSQSDRLALGKLVSKEDLGQYSIALGLASLVKVLAGQVINNVLFPLMSRAQSDRERLLAMFLKARAVLLRACAGCCAVIVIGGPLFFDTLYDERYASLGYYVQWITLWVWCGIMTQGIDHVWTALGNTRVAVVGGCVRTLGVPFAIIGFDIGGLPGLVCGFACADLLGQAVLVAMLPGRRVAAFRQSGLYSLLGGGYVGLALAIIASQRSTASHWSISLLIVALAIPPMLDAGLHTWRQLRS